MDSHGFANRYTWIRKDSRAGSHGFAWIRNGFAWIRMDSQTDKHGFAWIRGFAMDSQGFSRIRDADGFARIRERIRADSHGFSIRFTDGFAWIHDGYSCILHGLVWKSVYALDDIPPLNWLPRRPQTRYVGPRYIRGYAHERLRHGVHLYMRCDV